MPFAVLGAAFACSSSRTDTDPSPPADAGVDDPSRVVVGEVLVKKRACDSCHQSTNPADGILSGQTEPRKGTQSYPASLSPDDETGIGTWTNDDIVFAMRHGVDAEKQPLCAAMSRFDLTDDEASRARRAAMPTATTRRSTSAHAKGTAISGAPRRRNALARPRATCARTTSPRARRSRSATFPEDS